MVEAYRCRTWCRQRRWAASPSLSTDVRKFRVLRGGAPRKVVYVMGRVDGVRAGFV